MVHFIKYSKASKENRVLLILDNHESHVSADVIQLAKDNGITLLTLPPPHCSNKLQPLDITVYASFKSKYNAALNNWMLSNPGKTVSIYNIPAIVSQIMSSAFTQANIVSGFKNAGIYPLNSDIFGDDDFLCSAVTDREENSTLQLPELSSISPTTSLNIAITTSSPIFTVSIPAQAFPSTSRESPIPSTSHSLPIQPTSLTSSTLSTRAINVTPKMIKPLPKALPRKTTRRGRQPGKTKILTKTPDKLDVPQESLIQCEKKWKKDK